MRTPLVAVALYSFLSVAQAGQPDSATAPIAICERCGVILKDIRTALLEHCQSAPSLEALRKQPIYLFLSIFDEVSQGGDREMAEQVYTAAIEGMECDNPDAGVKAAQRKANQLMSDNRS